MITPTLYRAFSPDGSLLYVGASSNGLARVNAHRSTSSWWPEVAAITVEHHATRDEAFAAERAAIAAERPRWNVQFNPARPQTRREPRVIVQRSTIDPDAIHTYLVEELAPQWGRNIAAGRILVGMRDQHQLARALGVTRQSVSKWERGISVPRDEMKREIAEALGQEVRCLFPLPDLAFCQRFTRTHVA